MVTKPRVSLQERAGAPRRTNGGSTRTPAELSKFGDLRIERAFSVRAHLGTRTRAFMHARTRNQLTNKYRQ
jgi:hypothetical protein